jgi:hypothetical protein
MVPSFLAQRKAQLYMASRDPKSEGSFRPLAFSLVSLQSPTEPRAEQTMFLLLLLPLPRVLPTVW